jgi:hypothetical protein
MYFISPCAVKSVDNGLELIYKTLLHQQLKSQRLIKFY